MSPIARVKRLQHGGRIKIGRVSVGLYENRTFAIRALLMWGAGPRELMDAVYSLKLAPREPTEGFSAYCWSFEDDGKNPDAYVPPEEKLATHALLFARPLETLKSPYGINLLSHEITHLVCMTFRLKGLELNDGSEEAYTYMIGDVMECVCKMMGLFNK